MSIISYAQNFEDVMLWRALGKVENGFYIDIGAQDPIIDSVSMLFHEHGWKGIHVEPVSHYAELLKKQRPGDIVINAAVGEKSGILPFFEIPDTGISTADPIIAQQHRNNGYNVREANVTCITLYDIFELSKDTEIHWLKIDVEGFEKQVLSSWCNCGSRPWIVVIESTHPLTQIETFKTWEPILIDCGYTFDYFDGLNRFYISLEHPELKDSFQVPPNIFDDFELSGMASAPFQNLLNERYRQKIDETALKNEQERELAVKEIERIKSSIALQRNEYSGRENELTGQIQEILSRSRDEAQGHIRELKDRGKEYSEQLVLIQKESQKAATEQKAAYAERGKSLQDELASVRGTLEKAQAAAAGREKELTGQIQEILNRSRDEAQGHIRELKDRGKEYSEQLALIQKESQKAATEQKVAYSERGKSLQDELASVRGTLEKAQAAAAGREKELTGQIQEILNRSRDEAQAYIMERKNCEYLYFNKIDKVQKELADMTSEKIKFQNLAELNAQFATTNANQAKNMQTTLIKLMDNNNAKFEVQINSLQEQIKILKNSRSWKITAPLRLISMRLFNLKTAYLKLENNDINIKKNIKADINANTKRIDVNQSKENKKNIKDQNMQQSKTIPKISFTGKIIKIRGVSNVEEWGRWSDSKQVAIEFAEPLPEYFMLSLTAMAFGPNVGKEFVVRIGEDSQIFILEGQPTEKELHFSNTEGSQVITIDIPLPTAPASISKSEDNRTLGLGLCKLEISNKEKVFNINIFKTTNKSNNYNNMLTPLAREIYKKIVISLTKKGTLLSIL